MNNKQKSVIFYANILDYCMKRGKLSVLGLKVMSDEPDGEAEVTVEREHIRDGLPRFASGLGTPFFVIPP